MRSTNLLLLLPEKLTLLYTPGLAAVRGVGANLQHHGVMTPAARNGTGTTLLH